MNCDHIKTEADWVHFRCLSALFGNPSDLAIKVVPKNNNNNNHNTTSNIINDDSTAVETDVWVHSQSRIGEWDENNNDYLVRLLFSYKHLCDMKHTGIKCNNK